MENLTEREELLVAAGIGIGIAYVLDNMPWSLLHGDGACFIGGVHTLDKMRAGNAFEKFAADNYSNVNWARVKRAESELDATDENKIS